MKVVGLQTHIWSNNIKSMLLLAVFPMLILLLLLFLTISFTLGSEEFVLNTILLYIPLSMCSTVLVLIWFLVAFIFNKKIISMLTRSRPLERRESPRVYNIVENLCISRGLPIPKIYIMDDPGLNAYASGLSPKDSIVAFSRGLVDNLDDDELEAVAAHELTHIINRDVRLMVIAIVFVGIIQTLAEFIIRINFFGGGGRDRGSGGGILVIIAIQIVTFLVSYVFAVVVQLAISRKREYMADAGAVELTKKSEPLISALEKISSRPNVSGIKNQSVAQIFFENPLAEKKKVGFFQKIFSTHPPVTERIAALRMIG